MLEKRFKKIIDINRYYSEDLSDWSNDTENLNDDALLKMLQNLLKEYDMKSELLMQKLKFDKEIYKKKRKYREKSVRAGVAHEIKKTKFEIKKRNKLNKKLYKLFKKKLKIDFRNEFTDKLSKFNDYCDSQKKEEVKENLIIENSLEELKSDELVEGSASTGLAAENNFEEKQNDTSIKEDGAEMERTNDNMAEQSGDDGVGDKP